MIDFSNTNKYELQDFGRKLVVKNLTSNDEGSYMCIADNKVQQQANLNVTCKWFLLYKLPLSLSLSLSHSLSVPLFHALGSSCIRLQSIRLTFSLSVCLVIFLSVFIF